MIKNTFSWQWLRILFPLIVLCTLCFSACGGTTATKPAPTRTVTGTTLLSGSVVYVALGASDAVGVGTQQPDVQGYVPQIAARLPHKSHLIDLGISGIHLHDALTRELPLALSASPQLVTIWLAANDFVAGVTYDSYIQDLTTLLQQLRSGTNARIVMANLPDLTLLPSFSQVSADKKAQMQIGEQRWNAGIATVAARYHVGVVDLFGQQSALTSHPEYVSGDGFHPSPAGYTQLANLFWTVITSQKG